MKRTISSVGMLPFFLACLLAGAAQADNIEQLEVLKRDRDLDGIRVLLDDREELPAQTRLRWRAWLSTVEGNPEHALQLLKDAAAQAPDDADVHVALAAQLSRALDDVSFFGKMRLARQIRDAYAAALAAAPEHPGAHAGLTAYYQMAPRIAGGGMDRARDQVKLVRGFSKDLALALEAQLSEDPEEAVRLMKDAMALAPGNADYRFTLGLLHQNTGQYEQARTTFLQLVEENPAHAGAWYQLGRTAIFAEHDLDEGITAYERFLALPTFPGEPGHAAGWWRLGNLHELKGTPDRARDAYLQALRVDDGFDLARKALRKLQ